MHFTEEQWNTAYTWLCKQRLNYPANADIWQLRFNWHKEKALLKDALRSANFHFAPLHAITKKDGSTIHLWSSRDALVLKLITLKLANILPVSTRCTHVKNHGGLATINQVNQQRSQYSYVIRTDVKAYYASINHHLLIDKLAAHIKDKALLNLLWHYLNRMIERGGLFKEITKSISRGCPLSPLIGAFFLTELDEGFAQDGLFYVRYMDDILLLTKTRWKCRHAVKQLNTAFNQLKLEKHPDKTFIGKIEKGFDFLGYHFSPKGLRVADATVKRFIVKATRLYEQERENPKGSSQLGLYVRRWVRWTESGLGPHKKNPAGAGRFMVLMDHLSLVEWVNSYVYSPRCELAS